MNINFSYNWNNKLDCLAYSTIRLHKPIYKIGETYDILLKKEFKHKAQIVEIRNLKLNQLNEFIAHLDTGYSLGELKAILKKMYPKVNFETQQLSFILLKKIPIQKTQQKGIDNEG
jgi:hypothetical protein